jgi:hypothetical protein
MVRQEFALFFQLVNKPHRRLGLISRYVTQDLKQIVASFGGKDQRFHASWPANLWASARNSENTSRDDISVPRIPSSINSRNLD